MPQILVLTLVGLESISWHHLFGTEESLVLDFAKFEKVRPDVQILEILETSDALITSVRSCLVVELEEIL